MKNFDLLNTEEAPSEFHEAKLTIGISGQKALQVGQLFAMERMFKNWNDWRVKLAVWLIRRTDL